MNLKVMVAEALVILCLGGLAIKQEKGVNDGLWRRGLRHDAQPIIESKTTKRRRSKCLTFIKRVS